MMYIVNSWGIITHFIKISFNICGKGWSFGQKGNQVCMIIGCIELSNNFFLWFLGDVNTLVPPSDFSTPTFDQPSTSFDETSYQPYSHWQPTLPVYNDPNEPGTSEPVTSYIYTPKSHPSPTMSQVIPTFILRFLVLFMWGFFKEKGGWLFLRWKKLSLVLPNWRCKIHTILMWLNHSKFIIITYMFKIP